MSVQHFSPLPSTLARSASVNPHFRNGMWCQSVRPTREMLIETFFGTMRRRSRREREREREGGRRSPSLPPSIAHATNHGEMRNLCQLHARHSLTCRGGRKSQVRQCLGFWTADFWYSVAYESAEQKPKHCLTWDYLSALLTWHLLVRTYLRGFKLLFHFVTSLKFFWLQRKWCFWAL